MSTQADFDAAHMLACKHNLELVLIGMDHYQLRCDVAPWKLNMEPNLQRLWRDELTSPPPALVLTIPWTLTSVVKAAIKVMGLEPIEAPATAAPRVRISAAEWRREFGRQVALIERIAVAAEACQRVLESADDSPTPVADLEAEAESCGCSAKEPEPTLDDAKIVLDEADFTVHWLKREDSFRAVRSKAAAIVLDVMRANSQRLPCGCLDAMPEGFDVTIEPCPEPLMPAIEAGLKARADARWPRLTWSRHYDGVYSLTAWDGLARESNALVYRREWPSVVAFLESECPAPSEPEVRHSQLAWCNTCDPGDREEQTTRCLRCNVAQPTGYTPRP